MKPIIKTRIGSQHYLALQYLKKFRTNWYSPKWIIRLTNLDLTDSTLGRKLRYDRELGLLNRRIKDGYAEYKWRKNINNN